MASDQKAESRSIPDEMRRAVRQRCAFGCIICGHPLYDYHHMQPYAEVQQHTEENLTLLCDAHHRETHSGLLPPEKIIEANSSPFNRTAGVSSPYALHFDGKRFDVEVGSNAISGGGLPHPDGGIAFIPISVDDHDLIWFRVSEEGNIFLNLNLLDECNLPLLHIANNELSYPTDAWDITFEGRVLVVRQAPRNIFIEIEFRPPSGFAILRGRLLCNGVEIFIHKDRIFIMNSGVRFSNSRFKGGAIGVQLGRNDRGYLSCISTPPQVLKRYGLDREALLKQDKANSKSIEKMWESMAKK